MVCYEGKFAYSNHETDPASKQLCNAFDLCRIHLFGVQDEGTKITDNTRLPSYLKMQDFVAKDKKVRILLTKERQGQADDDLPTSKKRKPETAQYLKTPTSGWLN